MARVFSKLQTGYALHAHLDFRQFKPYILAFLASNLIAILVWRLQTYAVWEFELRVGRDIVIDIFGHLQQQGQSFHANRFGGALVSQTNKFVGAYERLMDDFVWSVITGVTALLFSLGVLAFVSFKFAIIMFVIVTIYLVIMSRRIRKTFPLNKAEAVLESSRTAALADAISNIGTIRAFTNEAHERSRFSDAANSSLRAAQIVSLAEFKNSAVSHSITNSFRICALLFGVYAVTNLHSSASVLYLVTAYTTAIVDRLWQFGRVTRNINRALGDSSEMTEILQLLPEITDPKEPEALRIDRGGIVFSNVDFQHDANPQNLFSNLNIDIRPGEKVGLVGQSGGGKTTLTGLLMRFMDVDGGEIRIDGQNIANITQNDLRRSISYVPQEPMLFHRSVEENIRYGQLEADIQGVRAVAKLAHADEFIEKLAHGYSTLVGERGVKLSGGQRQRIAIARAMLKDAPILVLDEATSALDSESEVLIQDALWKLMEGRTAIVIAHRLSTIQKMDRIIVLSEGRVLETGSHLELLKLDGTYAKLWAHQSGGFMED